MGRLAANFSLRCTRGATWDDEFTYQDGDGTAVDLTGFQARMQVRTEAGQFGLSGDTTLVLELSTANGALAIDEPASGVVALKVEAGETLLLNPLNEQRHVLFYGLELFKPEGADPEYVIPLVQGRLTVYGETVR